MLRQIFIVSDTPPDFSEPSDTDSRSPWLAEIIYWRGHKGEEETRLRYWISKERGYEGFQGCEDSIKVKRREIKISYRKFYGRERGVKKRGILSNAYFSFFLSLSHSLFIFYRFIKYLKFFIKWEPDIVLFFYHSRSRNNLINEGR